MMDLDLQAYADLIDLRVEFDRTAGMAPPRQALVAQLAEWLLADAGLADQEIPASDETQRQLIKVLLTIRPARSIPDATQRLLDELFASESAGRPIVTVEDLLKTSDAPVSVSHTAIKLWRGDITTLAVDAIVNAANSQLLGCFKPSHRCIDNAIHSVAGPRLRDDCHRIVTAQGHDEATGTAKITRGYYLPARFVLHTVGPIVRGGEVSEDHETALAACYKACLDVSSSMGLRSLAFCAISTGVFGYPKADAAAVALRTVTAWLEHNPGRFDLIVFNVFTAADEAAYRTATASPRERQRTTLEHTCELRQIRDWMNQADRVLIGAGAGLSADAGVDYTDEAEFATKFPELVKRGLRAPYQMIGYSALPPEAFWGYWLRHVSDVRYGDGRRVVYQRLFDLVREKDWFVLTSNVDALFARNGFNPARVCSIQGDFGFLQCLTPCSADLWPSAPVLERLLREIDPATQALRDPLLAPICPRCGGPVFFNVRGGDWFVEAPWRRQFGELRRG